MKNQSRTLLTLGIISLASVVKAEEARMNTLQTALSSTTISGYVNTSVNWNTIDNGFVAPIPFTSNKEDGFNLNVFKLSLEKAMDESEWAAGYKVDLLFGPDAIGYNPSTGGNAFVARNESFAVQQAYVALRTPVGNGIDWKMGVFNSILGYESFDAGNNPNFTRSYGYSIEPTEHTGILGSYRFCEAFAVTAGLANTLSAGINDRNNELGNARSSDAWRKTWMASIAITAPEDMGLLSHSTLSAGMVSGINNNISSGGPDGTANQNNYYAGVTLNTPVTGLRAGIAFDYVRNLGSDSGIAITDAWSLAGYLSYQATEKLSVYGRAEEFKSEALGAKIDLFELIGTIQYDLWKNVISRLEVRWDMYNDNAPGVGDTNPDAVSLYANFIYKF